MSVASGTVDRMISLNELRQALTQITEKMRSFVESLDSHDGETRLPNLMAAVDSMVEVFPNPPPYDASYTAEWIGFASGNRKRLDPSTVRYLCWEPNIATTDHFLAYLWRSGLKLTSRPLAGLVRSCHAVWKNGPGIYPAAGVIKDLVKQYNGSSQVIRKWKSNLNAIFGALGPETLGRSLINEKKKLNPFLEEWFLDPQSVFARQIVEKATALCRDHLDTPTAAVVTTLFGDLLPWGGWEMTALWREVGALILRVEDSQTRTILQRFVMIHRSLGDPRLPKNRANWSGIDQEAKNRFEEWLTKRSPSAPSLPPIVPLPASPKKPMERVYRQGKGWTLQPVGHKQYEAAKFGESWK